MQTIYIVPKFLVVPDSATFIRPVSILCNRLMSAFPWPPPLNSAHHTLPKHCHLIYFQTCHHLRGEGRGDHVCVLWKEARIESTCKGQTVRKKTFCIQQPFGLFWISGRDLNCMRLALGKSLFTPLSLLMFHLFQRLASWLNTFPSTSTEHQSRDLVVTGLSTGRVNSAFHQIPRMSFRWIII